MSKSFLEKLEVIAILLESALIKAAPKKTRHFAKSITIKVRKDGTIDVFMDKLWKILEFGSNPHVIMVKNKKVLADKEGRIFGKKVNHPGTRPTFFIRSTIKNKLPKIIKQVMEAN